MVRSLPVEPPRPPASDYRVLLGAGALDRLPAVLEGLGPPSRIHIVTDTRVQKACGRRLARALAPSGVPRSMSVVPPGERSKSARTLEQVWRDIVRAGCDRRSCVLGFGGGVVGDLAGFAAASALRGLDLVQVPTTLLAMVDASVGGKTGIDLPEGKNLVGAFHQPRAVVMDLDLLRTLPSRQLSAGFAEVVKTAAIRDRSLFTSLERHHDALLRRDRGDLLRVVEACVRIKAEVVRLDERETGLRMLLNFGHTLAHALEAAAGYAGLLHGEAVSVGMVFAARLGEELGRTQAGTAARLEALLRGFGLPTALPGRKALGPVLRAMERDKKRGRKGLRWVLLPAIGLAEIREDVSPAAVRAALARFAREGGTDGAGGR